MIPFWNFFNIMPYGPHTDPTEAQVRWQVNASLIYGAKGLLYFCYFTPGGDEFPKGGAIIGQDGLYASAVTDQVKKELIIKIANNANQPQQIDFNLEGKLKLKSKGTNEEIANSNLKQVNSFENPEAVSPKKSTINLKGKPKEMPPRVAN